MFTKIFQFEIKYWLKQPSVYIYAIILFGIAFATMNGMAAEPPDRFNGRIVNSPYFLMKMTKRFMLLFFLLLPAVMGMSVYRDFSTKMYAILYAYPFTKKAYLSAKFLSAFTVSTMIMMMLPIAYFLGAQMPWVNPELVVPFDFLAYAQLVGLILLPNAFLLSALIFAIVLFSRNIYAGFISVMLLILVPQLSGALFAGESFVFWQTLLDPFGVKAMAYYTNKWSVAEQNELLLPAGGFVFWNRLFWMAIAALLFAGVLRYFRFHQHAFSFSLKKGQATAITTSRPGNILNIVFPKANYDFSFVQQLKNTWKLSTVDFRYILTSKSFLSLVLAGLIFVLLTMSTVNPRFETETLPMTWQMLELPSMFYAGVINVITFLYAGLLVHRERMSNMDQLVNVSPIPDWVLLVSKFIALVKMQILLLFLVMIGGIITQAMKGFYDFEISQYLFNLYGLNLIHYMIWTMLAVFIQTLLGNPYLGFFLLLFAPVGFIGISEFGPQFLGLDFLEQMMFRYNQAPGEVFGLRYSDMDGYGPMLSAYFLYKTYWMLGGALLLFGAFFLWKRKITQSFGERLQFARQRFSGKPAWIFTIVLFSFLSMGTTFYYDANITHQYFTRQEKKKELAAAERKYKKYTYFSQPKIVDVKINMDIFPEDRQFKSTGNYIVINQTDKPIDTLVLNYIAGLHTTYRFDRNVEIISKDTIADFSHFDILQLTEKLNPGDSLFMHFANYNDPATLLSSNDFVKKHGTFLEDDIFPRFGNWLSFIRESNQMGNEYNKPNPENCSAHAHSFMAKDADRIGFEAVVSTAADQLAIAPGYLEKEWTENGRRYFHYKMDRKIALSYLFTSGRYAVARDNWGDIRLEVFYHKGHPYNIDRVLSGLKAGLVYCSENFSPYQFRQVRVIEFSQTGASSAHGFPNTIPAGEGSGFIAAVDDSETGGTDYAYGTAVHEVAHQWWGHQVIPADVRGSKMVVESLAEYVNVMVKKQEKGLDKMRKYLKTNLKMYLQFRNRDQRQEMPLLYAYPDQNYIHYAKGALAFYALSDYIGEENLNTAIKNFVQQNAYQEGRYTTSLEMFDSIKQHVPDSLQYLLKDMFETVTLYENSIRNWTSTKLPDGKYQVDIDFSVQKYRSGKNGKAVYSDAPEKDSLSWKPEGEGSVLHSLPLADYIDIGVFAKEKKEIYLQKHKIININNTISLIVNEAPVEVGVDPYLKLIDRYWGDNRMREK